MSAGRRGLLTTTVGTVVAWGVAWAVTADVGWRPRPLVMLASMTLAVTLWWLVTTLAPATAPLPRVQVRVVPSSPVGEDPRLLRHQLRLDDAVGDPPSCRPVLTRICELALERVRVAGHEPGSAEDRAELVGPRLAALLRERPPDRTRLSRDDLTSLVGDLEAMLPGPSATSRPSRRGLAPHDR